MNTQCASTYFVCAQADTNGFPVLNVNFDHFENWMETPLWQTSMYINGLKPSVYAQVSLGTLNKSDISQVRKFPQTRS